MNEQTLKKAIGEAERFLKAARAVKYHHGVTCKWIEGGKESGACKRASMDLTRALADLRRPG